MNKSFTLRYKEVGIKDVPEVGGKNASLGELIGHLKPKGVNIPDGFIITASAYRYFLKETGLEGRIKDLIGQLNVKKLEELGRVTKEVRDMIVDTDLPTDLKEEILLGYRQMESEYGRGVDVAVRSSATAEDLPGASFAGEHETYLNVRGEAEVIKATKKAMASLWTARATSYREDKGFNHFKVALSVGIQKMVRSDRGSSGVMFTLDTESGFRDTVLINGVYGLGEMIVQGEVTPDEWVIFKPTLATHKSIIHKELGKKDRKMVYKGQKQAGTKIIRNERQERDSFVLSDKEVLKLAKWGVLIEEHYSEVAGRWQPMDIEWALDGETKTLFIVQARPETVHATRDFNIVRTYKRGRGGVEIVKGASVGNKIASGRARVIMDVKDIHSFKAGEVLVTDMTDPDWEPIMKIAAGIVTDKGGRTSHAAIVSRELGIPCVVGSGLATKKIKTGDVITVDTTGSEGVVLKGAVEFKVNEVKINNLPESSVNIMVNVATPEIAMETSFLPQGGVGLAREEFIIANTIGIHPLALINFNKLDNKTAKLVEKKTVGWKKKTDFYVDKLAEGIGMIAAAFYPKPVIVRFSDFKSNEYASLLGGSEFEPQEENPMIGWRGASRYYNPRFEKAFLLEVEAIKKVREEFGLTNTAVMIPFCRTVEEGRKVIKLMSQNGLGRPESERQRKEDDLKIYVMCEIPANVILADEFLDVFDGMSIGSNDLTQLVLGIDRDGGELVRDIGNENNEAVKRMLKKVIGVCKKRNKYIGICGQAPSDYPELARWLVKEGISSISLNPDVVVPTLLVLGKKNRLSNE